MNNSNNLNRHDNSNNHINRPRYVRLVEGFNFNNWTTNEVLRWIIIILVIFFILWFIASLFRPAEVVKISVDTPAASEVGTPTIFRF